MSLSEGLLLFLCPLVTVSGACGDAVRAAGDQPSLSNSALVAIREGFDTRVAEMFEEQKALVDGAIDAYCDRSASGWNAPQRYAYPRIEYAAANLWFGRNIESANMALVEYAEYFIENPKQVLHRDHFHWHSEMALRLIEQYGQEGTKAPGLLTPETEDIILEAIWLYSKRMQKDQVGENTKAEADTEESNTWYIYESENHHAQSFCTLWHFAKLAKDRPGFMNRKYDDGRTASEHFQSWNEYINRYFTERAKKGIYIEAMSRDYNHKALKGIFNIFDFATDPELKRRAGLYLDLYFAYWGQEQIDGVAGGGKSRLYSDISPGTSEYGYLFFGLGEKPRYTSTLLSAMTTSYRPPLVVVDIVRDRQGRGDYEVLQRPLGLAEEGYTGPPVYHMRTDYGGIARYSYCTPDFVIGTSMIEARPAGDWALISSQNRSHGVIFAGNNNAGILPQCDKTGSNRSYNAQWSVQRKGTLICQKLETSRRAGRTKVWFSAAGLSEPIEDGNWVFAESKGAYAAVRVVDGGYSWEDEKSKTKGEWLICDSEYSPVILEVGKKADYQSFDDFREKVTGGALTFEHEILRYTSIYGDTFTFFADYSQAPRINGEAIDYAPPKAYDSPFLKADWNSGVVHIQKGTRSLALDFN